MAHIYAPPCVYIRFTVHGKLQTPTENCACVCEQLAIQMDVLEEYLKIEKLDPTQVPDAAIKHKEESFVKMTSEFSAVESSGKQFIKEASDVSTILVSSTQAASTSTRRNKFKWGNYSFYYDLRKYFPLIL